MIDIKFLRENRQKAEEGMRAKNFESTIGLILDIDEEYRKLSSELQDLYSKRNKAARERDVETGRELKTKIDKLETEVKEKKEDLDLELTAIPNLPADDIVEQKENKVIKEGRSIDFNFTPKDHLELGENLDIIDVQRASKVSGARFAYLKNDAVLLEFALVQFAMSILLKEGFIPVVPPVLVKPEITRGLGYWEAGGHNDYYLVLDPACKKCGLDLGLKEVIMVLGEEKVFKLLEKYSKAEIDELIKNNVTINSLISIRECPQCGEVLTSNALYLAGTAEHSIVPIHKDEVFAKSDLPKRYVGFSSSFRREAGSYGKDTRGILRVHQFDKVEMVSFTTAEDGDREHEYLLSLEEKLWQSLKIPYQVVRMAPGDLGFPVARKYDLEAWIPSQNKYREVTSTSTTTDFQARRLNIKYQDGGDKKFVHILNGTAFAIGRTIVAILENYQQEDGSVKVPEVLRKYLGKSVIKK